MENWAKNHNTCVKCDLTKYKHQAKGLCRRCYKQEYRKTPSGKAERKRHFQKWSKTEHGKNILYNRQLVNSYGINLDIKRNILEKQLGKCAICGLHIANNIRGCHVDHDHATGIIRGVLCPHCNLGLGHFKDDSFLLRKATDYLEKRIFDNSIIEVLKNLKDQDEWSISTAKSIRNGTFSRKP